MNLVEFSGTNAGSYDLASKCQMADCLGQWDPPAGLPVLKVLSRRAQTTLKYSAQPLSDTLTRMAMLRGRAGDPAPFSEYAEWIVVAAENSPEAPPSAWLEPLKSFPTKPDSN